MGPTSSWQGRSTVRLSSPVRLSSGTRRGTSTGSSTSGTARAGVVKERLRQLKLEAARERLREAMSPLEEGAHQLKAAVHESASALRASLHKHGHLPGGSAKRARDLVRWFRLMSWQSDGELEA